MKLSEEGRGEGMPRVRITGGEFGNTYVWDEDGNKIPFVESIEWKIGGRDANGQLDTQGFARITLLRRAEIDIEVQAEIEEDNGQKE